MFPYYLSMGMTYDLFWNDDPAIVKAYRKAYELSKKRVNEEMWVQGMYMAEALGATVGNMFSKGTKHEYPKEPFAITKTEQEERLEREQKARMERMKALFTAKALQINTKMGVSENDK